MRFSCTVVLMTWLLLLSAASSPAIALETRAYQMNEDFGSEPIYDSALQYYYYIPCPTYSWFWGFSGWVPGDIIGEWFQLGEISTGDYGPADPLNCQKLDQLRILDFAGYGPMRPGQFTVEFGIYCSDEYGCPVGPSLWNSGPEETGLGWNYIHFDPFLDISSCKPSPEPESGSRILVTATHIGPKGCYPAWGMDNISTAIQIGCAMHDFGGLPAWYLRPYSIHNASIHSGFYGQGFQYCPPRWFKDRGDTTTDGTQYGFMELCWRLYITCAGPSESQPATWGNIKSMYR